MPVAITGVVNDNFNHSGSEPDERGAQAVLISPHLSVSGAPVALFADQPEAEYSLLAVAPEAHWLRSAAEDSPTVIITKDNTIRTLIELLNLGCICTSSIRDYIRS